MHKLGLCRRAVSVRHVRELCRNCYHHLKHLLPFGRSHTSSYWRSIVIMVFSCIISEIKQYIGWKSRCFYIPHALDATVTDTRQTDRRTDGQTQHNGMGWLGYSRAAKTIEGEVKVQYAMVSRRRWRSDDSAYLVCFCQKQCRVVFDFPFRWVRRRLRPLRRLPMM